MFIKNFLYSATKACLCLQHVFLLLISNRASFSCQSTHTQTHPFNCPFPGTTQVSRYQKGKTNLDFTEARDSECQHPTTLFFTGRMPFLPPNQQCQSTEGQSNCCEFSCHLQHCKFEFVSLCFVCCSLKLWNVWPIAKFQFYLTLYSYVYNWNNLSCES